MLVLAALVAGVAVLVLHFWLLPDVNEYRTRIEASISRAAGQTVEIGRVEGGWRGYQPQLTFFGVQVHESGGQQTLILDRVDTVLSWRSFLQRTIVFERIELAGSELEVRRDSIGTIWVAGKAIERKRPDAPSPMLKWLFQQEQILIHQAQLTWSDEMRAAPPLVVEDVSLQFENLGKTHRFALTGTPPVELASAVKVNGEFLEGEDFADLGAWSGLIEADFEYANLAYAQQWAALPAQLKSGLGEMLLVVRMEGGQVREAVAEANLVNVAGHFGADQQPFALASLSGKLKWDEEDSAGILSLSGVTFETTDGLRLPPTDISVRRIRGQDPRTEVTITSLDLAPVAALSRRLPIDQDIRDKLGQLQPHGMVESLDAVWRDTGERREFVNAEVRVRDLGVSPLGKLPGFSGVTGVLALTQHAGSVELDSRGAALHMPAIFAMPVPFNYLSGKLVWERQEQGFRVAVSELSFTNDHAAGTASGTYHYPGKGRGDIDVRAKLVRAEAPQAWRYFPNQIAGTRDWIKQGLVAGKSDRVDLHLAGALDRFPFHDSRDGVFEISADVHDAVIQIGDGWPLIESASGLFRISGDRIEVKPETANILGVDVSQSRIAVSGLGTQDVRLTMDGRCTAQVGQYLDYVARSPVAQYTRGITLDMRGTGVGTLKLGLDLPLRGGKGASATGEFDLAGPEFRVSPAVPVLRDYAVGIEFTEKAFALRNGRGTMLGGDIRFGSMTSSDDARAYHMAGTANATEVAAFLDWPLLRDVYGSAEWKGEWRIDSQGSRLRLQSSLVGIGSRLPAPLDKLQPTALPLALNMATSGDGVRDLEVSVDKIGTVRLLTEGGSLRRGIIALGERAILPPRDGLIAKGELGQLDLDGWRAELAALPENGNALGSKSPDSLNLKIGRLLFGGRSFSDVRVAGNRAGSTWRLSLTGPQVKGNVKVESNDKGERRIDAQLTSLLLPPGEPELTVANVRERTQAAVQLPPALNVAVDEFEMDGMPLGRLELRAEPQQDNWRLDRLAISSPDGEIDVKGGWRVAGRPHAEYMVSFKAYDNGKFLKRLGYQESIVGGTGELSGPVSWLGSPFQPDLPTLSGKMKLLATKGRFAQVDPGAAQLIGILSLQALPRRITLDFKDVFTPGFSFDKIEADVVISDGVARTDDFRMEGVAAHVTMKGQVSLVEETQDLEVHVRPQLSGAAAVAGAAVINPLVGIATLLVQKALGDPVEQIASRDYRVTGTWSKPDIERIVRKSVPPAKSAAGR